METKNDLCGICSFPITSHDTNKTQLPQSSQFVHQTCLPNNSWYAHCVHMIAEEKETEKKHHGLPLDTKQHDKHIQNDIVHSAFLYRSLCQLWFHCITITTHVKLDDKTGWNRRCHPLYGCNQIKLLHDFNVLNVKPQQESTESASKEKFMDVNTIWMRQCRACFIQQQLHTLNSRNRKKQFQLKALLNGVIQKYYDKLFAIVHNKAKTKEELQKEIDAFCLQQWKIQQGKCSRCFQNMACGLNAKDPNDIDNTFIHGLTPIEFRYVAKTHQVEWIHTSCNDFEYQQCEIACYAAQKQYKIVMNKNNNDDNECLCQYFQMRCLDFVRHLCRLVAPFVAVLKQDSHWIRTWNQYRKECGDVAFQEVATFLLELQHGSKKGI